MFENLNEDNFLIYAMKNYNSPNVTMDEFEEDIKRLKYIKRLIKRYKSTGELKERLILNHIIVLGNVFGVEATVRMLFYKFDQEDLSIIKTFLLFLQYMPARVRGIKGKEYLSSDISIDMKISKLLMQL